MNEDEFACAVFNRLKGVDPLAILAAACKVRFTRNAPLIKLADDAQIDEFIQKAGLTHVVVLPEVTPEDD